MWAIDVMLHFRVPAARVEITEINLKQEAQILKRSIVTLPTGFLCSHLLYITSNIECLDYFLPLHNGVIAQVLDFS